MRDLIQTEVAVQLKQFTSTSLVSQKKLKANQILGFHMIYFIVHSLHAIIKTEMALVFRKLITQGGILLQ